MARTSSHTSSDAATSSTSSRITKTTSDRTSARNTRQRSRFLAEASSSGMLQGMVDEAQDVGLGASGGSSSSRGKGKSRAVDEPPSIFDYVDNDEDWVMVDDNEDPCPVTDKDINPFRIMDLPTEIRLEIYRACLTRPYNILLSRREQPQPAEPEADDDDLIGIPDSPSDGSEDDGDSAAQVTVQAPPTQGTHGRRTLRRAMNSMGFLRPAARAGRPALPSASSTTSSNAASTAANRDSSNTSPFALRSAARSSRFRRNLSHSRSNLMSAPEPERKQTADPLLVNILRASKEIYKEARGVFYSENNFTLDLNTAMSTLACLHQRSRRQIKHVELEIPTYNEILERFQETVRLNLRYCSGLKKLVINMPFTLPGADGSGTTGNTTVYANGFDILRWLPQECAIELRGNICTEIETVVNKHLHLAKTLDKLAYARRQLISGDTGPSTTSTSTSTAAAAAATS